MTIAYKDLTEAEQVAVGALGLTPETWDDATATWDCGAFPVPPPPAVDTVGEAEVAAADGSGKVSVIQAAADPTGEASARAVRATAACPLQFPHHVCPEPVLATLQSSVFKLRLKKSTVFLPACRRLRRRSVGPLRTGRSWRPKRS